MCVFQYLYMISCYTYFITGSISFLWLKSGKTFQHDFVYHRNKSHDHMKKNVWTQEIYSKYVSCIIKTLPLVLSLFSTFLKLKRAKTIIEISPTTWNPDLIHPINGLIEATGPLSLPRRRWLGGPGKTGKSRKPLAERGTTPFRAEASRRS